MNHPENEILLALFDGELSDIETVRIERHTVNCAECRERLAGLEQTAVALAGVIAGLDAAEPAHWPTERPARAERPALPDRVLPFEPEPARRRAAPRRSHGTAPLRWAAGILLLAGAGAAATIYARPWADDAPAPGASPATTQAAPAGDEAEPNVFNVTPVAGSLDVAITGVGGPTRIVVAFAEQGDVTIEATGPDDLHVENPRGSLTLDLGQAAATLRITFPTSLASGTIRVDGRTIARVSAGRLDRIAQVEGVTLTAEAADRS